MPGLVVFQSVDNQYEWGTYFDLEVLIMTHNSYFNATKLCKDNGKRFNNWLRNQGSDELIRSTHFRDQPIITISTGLNDYRGTYVPRKLITHIASWISTDIACKVHDIVEEYLLKKEKMKHEVVVKEKNEIIDKKDNKIDSLETLIRRMESKNNTEFNDIKATVNDLTNNVSKLSLDNKNTHEKLDNVQNTLNIVVEDRVVKTKDIDTLGSIVIYESLDQGPNVFRIFRVQKRSLKSSIKRYKLDNPNAVKFFEIEYNPNSINYYQRFKQEYKNEIQFHYNKFELLSITKEQLKQFIEEINNEKYNLEK